MQKSSFRIRALIPAAIVVSAACHAAVLTPLEDNSVNRGANTTVQHNSGSDDFFFLKEAADNQSNTRRTYFKFNMAGLTPGADGADATFTVTTTGSFATYFDLRLFALNPTTTIASYQWKEDEITWNNAPGRDNATQSTFYLNQTQTTGMTSTSTRLASSAAVGTQLTFSLTNWSQFLQPDETLTLILVSTDQGTGSLTLSMASSEHANSEYRPQLVTVPEPGTAMLVALAGAGLFRRRR